jgi:multiple sugar transport system permease protein
MVIGNVGGRGAARPATTSTVAATGFMVVATLYFLAPLWWLIVTSAREGPVLTGGTSLWFQGPFDLFTNIANVVTTRDGVFLAWMLNSLVYAGVGALVATVVAGMAGYALAKYAFPGKEATFNVILAGVLVPATALALPLFLLFAQLDLTDTRLSVLLPSMVSPFGVYLARIYATSAVPDDLLEAARLDGASELRTFATISTRLMAPALVTIFLFQFVAIWNNYFLPLVMLQNARLFPVTIGLQTWNTQTAQDPALQLYVVVGALLSVLPLIAAFLLLQRFWRSGLAAGSVK